MLFKGSFFLRNPTLLAFLNNFFCTLVVIIAFPNNASANSKCLPYFLYGYNQSFVHFPNSANFCIQSGDGEINIPELNTNKIGRFIFIAFIGIVLAGSFYTVGANENAVLTRLGKYSSTTMPGLHFKIPIIDRIEKVKVDYQYKLEFGFRTLKPGVKTKYSTRNFADESWMLTGDLKIADVRWVVQYKIKDAAEYLFNVKNVQNTIRDVSEATMRLMIGDRSFNEVIKSERSAVSDGARLHMQAVQDLVHVLE